MVDKWSSKIIYFSIVTLADSGGGVVSLYPRQDVSLYVTGLVTRQYQTDLHEFHANHYLSKAVFVLMAITTSSPQDFSTVQSSSLPAS